MAPALRRVCWMNWVELTPAAIFATNVSAHEMNNFCVPSSRRAALVTNAIIINIVRMNKINSFHKTALRNEQLVTFDDDFRFVFWISFSLQRNCGLVQAQYKEEKQCTAIYSFMWLAQDKTRELSLLYELTTCNNKKRHTFIILAFNPYVRQHWVSSPAKICGSNCGSRVEPSPALCRSAVVHCASKLSRRSPISAAICGWRVSSSCA